MPMEYANTSNRGTGKMAPHGRSRIVEDGAPPADLNRRDAQRASQR